MRRKEEGGREFNEASGLGAANTRRRCDGLRDDGWPHDSSIVRSLVLSWIRIPRRWGGGGFECAEVKVGERRMSELGGKGVRSIIRLEAIQRTRRRSRVGTSE